MEEPADGTRGRKKKPVLPALVEGLAAGRRGQLMGDGDGDGNEKARPRKWLLVGA